MHQVASNSRLMKPNGHFSHPPLISPHIVEGIKNTYDKLSLHLLVYDTIKCFKLHLNFQSEIIYFDCFMLNYKSTCNNTFPQLLINTDMVIPLESSESCVCVYVSTCWDVLPIVSDVATFASSALNSEHALRNHLRINGSLGFCLWGWGEHIWNWRYTLSGSSINS